MIVFALSFYSYHAAKVLVPLTIFVIVFVYKESFNNFKKTFLLPGLIFLILSFPIIYGSIFKGGQNRFSEVSIFSDRTITDQVILKRSEEGNTGFSSVIFHNKVEAFGRAILGNYLQSFSPQFLFLYGDPNYRQSSGFGGEFLYIFLPFLVLGFLSLLKEKKYRRTSAFIFFWLFASPLPSIITQDGSMHASRLIFMAPPLILIIAYGISSFIIAVDKIGKYKLKLFLCFLLVIFFGLNLSFYLHQYFVDYPKESWRFWAYGYKEAMMYLKKEENNFDRIFINNSYEPSILWFLFWSQYPPAVVQKTLSGGLDYQTGLIPGAKIVELGRYYFYLPNDENWKYGGLEEILKLNPNALVLASASDDTAGDKDLRAFPLTNTKLLKTIISPEGKPIFYFLTSSRTPQSKK